MSRNKNKNKNTGTGTRATEAPAGKQPQNATTNAPTDHSDPKQVGKEKARQATEAGGALPHGVLPDQVQLNQNLGQISNDLNTFRDRVNQLLAGSDHEDLDKALEKVQTLVSKKLGLED